jgi:hypothetical protein
MPGQNRRPTVAILVIDASQLPLRGDGVETAHRTAAAVPPPSASVPAAAVPFIDQVTIAGATSPATKV